MNSQNLKRNKILFLFLLTALALNMSWLQNNNEASMDLATNSPETSTPANTATSVASQETTGSVVGETLNDPDGNVYQNCTKRKNNSAFRMTREYDETKDDILIKDKVHAKGIVWNCKYRRYKHKSEDGSTVIYEDREETAGDGKFFEVTQITGIGSEKSKTESGFCPDCLGRFKNSLLQNIGDISGLIDDAADNTREAKKAKKLAEEEKKKKKEEKEKLAKQKENCEIYKGKKIKKGDQYATDRAECFLSKLEGAEEENDEKAVEKYWRKMRDELRFSLLHGDEDQKSEATSLFHSLTDTYCGKNSRRDSYSNYKSYGSESSNGQALGVVSCRNPRRKSGFGRILGQNLERMSMGLAVEELKFNQVEILRNTRQGSWDHNRALGELVNLNRYTNSAFRDIPGQHTALRSENSYWRSSTRKRLLNANTGLIGSLSENDKLLLKYDVLLGLEDHDRIDGLFSGYDSTDCILKNICRNSSSASSRIAELRRRGTSSSIPRVGLRPTSVAEFLSSLRTLTPESRNLYESADLIRSSRGAPFNPSLPRL